MFQAKTLFLGEINVDLIFAGLSRAPIEDREVRADSFSMTIGSSTAICACAYSGLGGLCSFAGLAGADYFGDFMLRKLEDYGVQTEGIKQSPSVQTGVTVNIIRGQTRSQINYPGCMEEYDGSELLDASFSGFSYLHTAGIFFQKRLLPNLKKLFSMAKKQGLTTSLDTQWDESEQWAYLEKLLPFCDCLFVNEKEAISISGQKSLENAYDYLSVKMDKKALVLIKIGKRGVLLGEKGTLTQIAAPEIELVDSTGAGDNFNAGFLYGRNVLGVEAESAAGLGTHVAALCCQTRGGVAEKESYREMAREITAKE